MATEKELLNELLSAVKELVQVDKEALEATKNLDEIKIRWADAVNKVLITAESYNI